MKHLPATVHESIARNLREQSNDLRLVGRDWHASLAPRIVRVSFETAPDFIVFLGDASKRSRLSCLEHVQLDDMRTSHPDILTSIVSSLKKNAPVLEKLDIVVNFVKTSEVSSIGNVLGESVDDSNAEEVSLTLNTNFIDREVVREVIADLGRAPHPKLRRLSIDCCDWLDTLDGLRNLAPSLVGLKVPWTYDPETPNDIGQPLPMGLCFDRVRDLELIVVSCETVCTVRHLAFMCQEVFPVVEHVKVERLGFACVEDWKCMALMDPLMDWSKTELVIGVFPPPDLRLPSFDALVINVGEDGLDPKECMERLRTTFPGLLRLTVESCCTYIDELEFESERLEKRMADALSNPKQSGRKEISVAWVGELLEVRGYEVALEAIAHAPDTKRIVIDIAEDAPSRHAFRNIKDGIGNNRAEEVRLEVTVPSMRAWMYGSMALPRVKVLSVVPTNYVFNQERQVSVYEFRALVKSLPCLERIEWHKSLGAVPAYRGLRKAVVTVA